MKMLKPTCLFATLWLSTGLFAQLPSVAGALKTGSLPPGAVGIRIGDFSRSLKDGGQNASLDMLRVTATLQVEGSPGIYPWIEAGWHQPKVLGNQSPGGFTWGTGVHLRPLLFPLRNDPALGPRDWLALTLDLAVRGGEADADAGKLDWLSFEGVAGVEWHQKYLGRNDGPMGADDLTAGAGVIVNSFQTSQGSFDGSGNQKTGLRLNTGFSFRGNNFLKLELDLFGSSNRRISLVSGFKF